MLRKAADDSGPGLLALFVEWRRSDDGSVSHENISTSRLGRRVLGAAEAVPVGRLAVVVPDTPTSSRSTIRGRPRKHRDPDRGGHEGSRAPRGARSRSRRTLRPVRRQRVERCPEGQAEPILQVSETIAAMSLPLLPWQGETSPGSLRIVPADVTGRRLHVRGGVQAPVVALGPNE